MSTTGSHEILLLDVGHGNCAFLLDGSKLTVIDAPPGPTLIETLLHHKRTRLDFVLISHADGDHIGGLVGLLSDDRFSIGSIYLNNDSQKQTEVWQDLRVALRDARKRSAIEIKLELTTSTDLSKLSDTLRYEVVSPAPEIAMGGVGSTDVEGRPLTSNSMSAVIRVHHGTVPVLLLTGDLDGVSLQNMEESHAECQAKVMVFPHHGGRPGSADPQTFSQRLCRLVRPDAIVFSLGRNRFQNPSPEVVQGARLAAPKAYIACTQLSRHCATTPPFSRGTHFAQRPASGLSERQSCAGTLIVNPVGPPYITSPQMHEHLAFIGKYAPSALCLARVPLPTRTPVKRAAAKKKLPTRTPVKRAAAKKKLPTRTPVKRAAAKKKLPTRTPVKRAAAKKKLPTRTPVKRAAAKKKPPAPRK